MRFDRCSFLSSQTIFFFLCILFVWYDAETGFLKGGICFSRSKISWNQDGRKKNPAEDSLDMEMSPFAKNKENSTKALRSWYRIILSLVIGEGLVKGREGTVKKKVWNGCISR